jgi:hypothetical protein
MIRNFNETVGDKMCSECFTHVFAAILLRTVVENAASLLTH